MRLRNQALTILALAAALGRAAAGEGETARGLNHFYNLEYDQAAARFRAAIGADAGNLDARNQLAQTILYRAMYRTGLMEGAVLMGDDVLLSLFRLPKLALSADEEREFQQATGAVMSQAGARLKSAPQDAAAMYALGAAHGLRASHAMLVRKAWLDALRDSNAARELHNQVARLDPANVDARMMQGVNDYVVATLPRGVRWLAAVVGVRGDRQKGLATLAEVAARGRRNREDARILLATIYRHERMGRESARLVEQLEADYPRNALFALARVYTLLEAGDAGGAWSALRGVEERVAAARPGYAGLNAAKLLYARGYLEMRGGDLAAAAATLERAAAAAGGEDRLTRARSLVRLGQIHDLRGERDLAKESYRAVVAAAPGTRCGNESREYLARPYHGGETD